MSSATFKINYHNSRSLGLEEDRYMDDELCRLNEPGARVHEAPRYQSEYEQLCENDEAAADLYDELLDRAVQHGLPVADNAETRRGRGSYRCPVGKEHCVVGVQQEGKSRGAEKFVFKEAPSTKKTEFSGDPISMI